MEYSILNTHDHESLDDDANKMRVSAVKAKIDVN